MGTKGYKNIEELVADIKAQKSKCLLWFNEKKDSNFNTSCFRSTPGGLCEGK